MPKRGEYIYYVEPHKMVKEHIKSLEIKVESKKQNIKSLEQQIEPFKKL